MITSLRRSLPPASGSTSTRREKSQRTVETRAIYLMAIQGTNGTLQDEIAFPPLQYRCRTTFVTTNRAYSGSAIMLPVCMWLYFVMRMSSESAPFRNTQLLNRKLFVPNAAWPIASPPPIREKTKLARHLSLTSFKEEMRGMLPSSQSPFIA
jgi:hypothetical protein